MNLVCGGRFAPSLELKPFVSIETHPPTLLGLSQGWLKAADAPHLKPKLGHAYPCPGLYPRYSLDAHASVGTLATLFACAAIARTRLSGRI